MYSYVQKCFIKCTNSLGSFAVVYILLLAIRTSNEELLVLSTSIIEGTEPYAGRQTFDLGP